MALDLEDQVISALSLGEFVPVLGAEMGRLFGEGRLDGRYLGVIPEYIRRTISSGRAELVGTRTRVRASEL